MNCLYCGTQINPKIASQEEINYSWHSRCIKNFFDTTSMPTIDISEKSLQALVEENVNKGFTVAGVQKKISLHLSFVDKPRLTLVNYPTGYILKPQVKEFQNLPEAEFLVMKMAALTGIKTVPCALIKINNDIAYITKRIDRKQSNGTIQLLAMEDFCQLDQRLTQDKYKSSYERCAKVIMKYSHQSGLDLTEFYLRLIFSFIVGNSDMHLKNFSLIEEEQSSQKYMLSPAYDLLPINILMPEDTEEFALTMNGKKRNLRRNDFLKFANTCQIPNNVANNLINLVLSKELVYYDMCDKSLLSDTLKSNLKNLIGNRINRLKN